MNKVKNKDITEFYVNGIKVTKYCYNSLNEEYYSATLDNGLKVNFIKKIGYKFFETMFVSDFGGINTSFKFNGKSYKVPTGVAHFLEHKLFSDENGQDISLKFNELNLYCNAYTSYNFTNYNFSGVHNFEKGLELLLDFVQTPHFTIENIEKERGIILQELYTYDDNPTEKVASELDYILINKNACKYDLIGKPNDIKKISKETLDFCHKVFYHPSNMNLYIIGGFDEVDLFKLIINNQSKKKFSSEPHVIIKDVIKEDRNVCKHKSIIKYDTSVPEVAIGLKFDFDDCTEEDRYRRKSYVNMLLYEEFTTKSPLYRQMLNKGLITTNIRNSFYYQNGLEYISFGFSSPKPNEAIEMILNKLKDLKNSNVTKKEFNLTKKSYIANWIGKLNNFDDEITSFINRDKYVYNLFESDKLINTLDYEECNNYIHELFNIEIDDSNTSIVILGKNIK